MNIILPPVPSGDGCTVGDSQYPVYKKPSKKVLTCLRVHAVFCRRFLQVWERGLGRVVGAQNINIHDRLESVDRQLIDRGKEVSSGTGTATNKSDTSKGKNDCMIIHTSQNQYRPTL